MMDGSTSFVPYFLPTPPPNPTKTQNKTRMNCLSIYLREVILLSDGDKEMLLQSFIWFLRKLLHKILLLRELLATGRTTI